MPSHYKFKEYCPLVFRNLRERFGMNEATYLVRACVRACSVLSLDWTLCSDHTRVLFLCVARAHAPAARVGHVAGRAPAQQVPPQLRPAPVHQGIPYDRT